MASSATKSRWSFRMRLMLRIPARKAQSEQKNGPISGPMHKLRWILREFYCFLFAQLTFLWLIQLCGFNSASTKQSLATWFSNINKSSDPNVLSFITKRSKTYTPALGIPLSGAYPGLTFRTARGVAKAAGVVDQARARPRRSTRLYGDDLTCYLIW